MILALAAALLAADALPFAPPIDTPLRYREVEYRVMPDGGAVHYTLTEDVTYARDGAGYVLTIKAVSADTSAPPGKAAVFDAGMKPFLGIPVRLRLSPGGEPGALIDGDATWARVVTAIGDAAAAARDSPPGHHAAMVALARRFAALPTDARDALMKQPAIALLGLSLPPLPVGGEAPIGEDVDTPFGSRLASRGTIRRLAADNGSIHYVADGQTDPDGAAALAAQLRAAPVTDPAERARLDHQADDVAALRLHLRTETTLSASSGLLLSSVRRTAAIDPAAPGGERAISDRELTLVSH